MTLALETWLIVVDSGLFSFNHEVVDSTIGILSSSSFSYSLRREKRQKFVLNIFASIQDLICNTIQSLQFRYSTLSNSKMILALVQAPSPVLLELMLPVPELAWLKRNVMTKPESKPEAALKDSVSVAYLWPTLAMPSFRKIALMPELQLWLMEISAAFPSKNANKVSVLSFL